MTPRPEKQPSSLTLAQRRELLHLQDPTAYEQAHRRVPSGQPASEQRLRELMTAADQSSLRAVIGALVRAITETQPAAPPAAEAKTITVEAKLPVDPQVQKSVLTSFEARTGRDIRSMMVPQDQVQRIVYAAEKKDKKYKKETSSAPYVSPQSDVPYRRPPGARVTLARTEDVEGRGVQVVDMSPPRGGLTSLVRQGLAGLLGAGSRSTVATLVTPIPIPRSDMVAERSYQELGRGPVKIQVSHKNYRLRDQADPSSSSNPSSAAGEFSGPAPASSGESMSWPPSPPAQDLGSKLGRALRSSITGR